jgi:hypothetical protein
MYFIQHCFIYRTSVGKYVVMHIGKTPEVRCIFCDQNLEEKENERVTKTVNVSPKKKMEEEE